MTFELGLAFTKTGPRFLRSQDRPVKSPCMASSVHYLYTYYELVLQNGVCMRSPEVTVRVLQELMKKGAIKAALACRSDLSVSYIIQFIKR